MCVCVCVCSVYGQYWQARHTAPRECLNLRVAHSPAIALSLWVCVGDKLTAKIPLSSLVPSSDE